MKPLAVVAGALLLSACGGGTHTTASTVTVTQTVTVEAAAPEPASGLKPPPPTGSKTVIDPFGTYTGVIDRDGTYLVGVDIMPGMYRTAGGATCSWARLGSLDTGDIIDSWKGSGPQRIQIKESDTAFLTQDCGTWQMMHVPSVTGLG
ncbi:hypothetical protein PJK45_06820 [Mycobacterium kansasii]|uniref:Lipoprotein n=2 Tax=Mycobacterium kansasii TaxID=1768 RepID=A0A653EHS1_MYCKA|nr:hypothetical protein [Mycobacterium kansasii]AGZ53611.1 hypothetical protein MKAN_27395 [Mycobacterium kansasii ATCC 12478]ARG54800.1 hypothetical protein B1T43_01770 [Mycobacterium kansasii]ARG60252.1 hypothetical protein B1T45_01775 [Mycobacterium kansasii]ARG67986.1 hypothetical protein B1T47_01870 [Mycobacterium kansasii]ARG77499.1 hypothetical protein B1T51_26950 [Mycobacterium kansasii]